MECVCNGVVHAGAQWAWSKMAQERGESLEWLIETCGPILHSGAAEFKFWRGAIRFET